MGQFRLLVFSDHDTSAIDELVQDVRFLGGVRLEPYRNDPAAHAARDTYAIPGLGAVMLDGEREVARWQATLPTVQDIVTVYGRHRSVNEVIASIPPSPKRGDLLPVADVYAAMRRLMG